MESNRINEAFEKSFKKLFGRSFNDMRESHFTATSIQKMYKQSRIDFAKEIRKVIRRDRKVIMAGRIFEYIDTELNKGGE